MVLLTNIEEFETKAKELIKHSPKKARLTTKYKKADHIFVMKITDGAQCYKIKIDKESQFRQSQKIIAQLMHLMTSSELMA